MKVEHSCKIISKGRISDTIYKMTLEVGDMVRTSFKAPGQFVHIRCGNDLLLRRPISVCDCGPSEPEDLLIIVFEVRGAGTAWLAGRKEGDTLDVLGLLGNGFDMKPGGRYLLVGGGIGVPPLYACARHTGCRLPTAILGFRSRKKRILLDEFWAVCQDVKIATDDGSMGYHGYVDALVRQELEEGNHYQGILACGPKPMLKNVAAVAKEFGIPCQVSMEERMGCGVGACLTCAVPMKDGTMKHACKDGPVFNAEEVDWDA